MRVRGCGVWLGALRVWQIGEQRPVMRADDILIEQAEHDAAKLAVAVSLEMFERQSAGDDLASGIGFSFSLFVSGFKGLQLGVDLIASLAEEREPVGRASARHWLGLQRSLYRYRVTTRCQPQSSVHNPQTQCYHPDGLSKGALMHYLRKCVRSGGVVPPADAMNESAWSSATLRETRRGDLFAQR